MFFFVLPVSRHQRWQAAEGTRSSPRIHQSQSPTEGTRTSEVRRWGQPVQQHQPRLRTDLR